MTGIQYIHYKHPAMQKFCKAIRKEVFLQMIAALSLLLVGFLLVVFSFNQNTTFTILGMLGLLFGIRLSFVFFQKRKLENNRIIQLLTHQPSRIVWVYSVVTYRMPFGFQTARSGILYFKLVDGDEESVSIPAKDLKLISRFLNRILPHATFGYSEEREQWFATAPELLIRKQDDSDANPKNE